MQVNDPPYLNNNDEILILAILKKYLLNPVYSFLL